MAIGLTDNQAWFDKAFVSIAEQGSTEVQMRAFTNSLSFTGGGPTFESLDVFGGKIPKSSNREDIELSFDGIPATTRDFDWIFHGASSGTGSISTFTPNKKYRVTWLWTDETGITSATSAIATSSEAYRHYYVDARNTQLDYNMDAGENLSATIGFSLAVEDETGGANVKKEFAGTSSVLAVGGAYTSANKF